MPYGSVIFFDFDGVDACLCTAQDNALEARDPSVRDAAIKHFLAAYPDIGHQPAALDARGGGSFVFRGGGTVIMLGYGIGRGWSHGVSMARTCHGYFNGVKEYDGFDCLEQAGQFALELTAAGMAAYNAPHGETIVQNLQTGFSWAAGFQPARRRDDDGSATETIYRENVSYALSDSPAPPPGEGVVAEGVGGNETLRFDPQSKFDPCGGVIKDHYGPEKYVFRVNGDLYAGFSLECTSMCGSGVGKNQKALMKRFMDHIAYQPFYTYQFTMKVESGRVLNRCRYHWYYYKKASGCNDVVEGGRSCSI